MHPATALAPALAALTESLNDPEVDLGIMLGSVSKQVVSVVPSFLGLTITVHSSGIPVTVSTIDAAALQSAGACLLLVLRATRANGDSMVFYAAEPGAFTDLIATTDPSNTSLNNVFVLDQHIPFVTDLPHPIGIDGLDEVSARNRAIGALIAGGCTLQQARRAAPQRVPIAAQGNPLKPSV